jgi:hypothetical protein
MAVGVPIGLTDSKTFDEWIANHDPVFSSNQESWSLSFTCLLRRMLTETVKNRITAAQILALPQIAYMLPTWILWGPMLEPNSEIVWEDS